MGTFLGRFYHTGTIVMTSPVIVMNYYESYLQMYGVMSGDRKYGYLVCKITS